MSKDVPLFIIVAAVMAMLLFSHSDDCDHDHSDHSTPSASAASVATHSK